MINHIMLDVDGVLADFFKHSISKHGVAGDPDEWARRNKGLPCWPRNHWGIADVLGISENTFWLPMDNADFWVSVPIYAGAREFVRAIDGFNVPWSFCTMPSRSPEASAGKLAWLRMYFPDYSDNFYLCGAQGKSVFHQNNILMIDDRADNLPGHGLLVPRPWNRMAPGTTFDTVNYAYVLEVLRGALQGGLD